MSVQTHHRVDERSIDRSLVQWVLKQAGNPNISVRLWNGDEFPITDGKPVACLEFRERRAVFEMLRSPRIGFGEAYAKGLVDVHGDFLTFANEVTAAMTRKSAASYWRPRLRSKLYAMRRNSLLRSRHNVRHHYDLGNDFYKLWLDERMVYTCAYYDTPAATLAEAQVAKLDHVCRKLQLQPGQRVIEAGCGWGALAIHMAEHYGVEVRAYNNSKEQVAFARQRLEGKGLEDKVEFVLDDYRTIDEPCDVFVSVGMLEHVGAANYRALGALVKRVLKPDGFGLIHTIGRSFPDTVNAWILKHVFPGGHIPSLSEMMSIFEPHKFSVLDVENLRPHYARTCAAWLQNFEAVADDVAEMYDEEFVRMWRLYLAGSSAGFNSGTLQLYQVVFAPSGNDKVPWTRKHQYPEHNRLADG